MMFRFPRPILALVGGFFLLSACSPQGSSDAEPSENVKMYKLAHMNGCIECHRVKATVVGPSWEAIALRYKDAPREEVRALLIESVKKGSRGKFATWKGGDGMPPLERRVAAEHIETLVDYILSLNPPAKG